MIASAMASLKCVCIKNILLIVSLAAILPQVYSQGSDTLTEWYQLLNLHYSLLQRVFT